MANLDRTAPVCDPAPRRYSGSFKLLRFSEFGRIFSNWDQFEVGQTRRLPGTKGYTSSADVQYFRPYVKAWGFLNGLFIALDYGLQIDAREQCIKIVRLR